MAGLLRNTRLRSQRESIDTGQGVQRTAGDTQREAHVGRGTFVNWYDDLGISTTRPAADGIRKEEDAFKRQVAEKEAEISSVRGKLNSAYGEVNAQASQLAGTKLPQLNTAVEKAWGGFKSTLTPVRVMGPNDTIEAVYYLPRDGAMELVGQRGLYATWHENDTVLNVMAKNYRNQEVHDPLRSASATLESQYKAKAQEQIAKELGIASSQLQAGANAIGAAKGELAGYEAQVSAAEGMLSGVKQEHQKKWDDIHNRYKERASKMSEILSTLQVNKGAYEDSQS